MSTPAMHAAPHAAQISEMVEMFKRGEVVDERAMPMCKVCHKVEYPNATKKLLQCSRCKVVRYCDEKCSLEDWNGQIMPNGGMGQRHRDVCMTLKRSLEKRPEMQAIAKQFPWARPQVDGTFGFHIFRASLDLLGTGAEFGWWTEKPCCNDEPGYVQGFLLLENQHFQERAGWKLPDDQIPWLDSGISGLSPPEAPPSFEHTWTDYYKWRGLPIQSPAALLLHWPLTVYRLLHTLGLVPAQPPTERRRLAVHVLGIERELDFLPIFGELALLLPNTDIDLLLFGSGVTELLAKARRKPSCLASQPFVYTYTSQQKSGGGSIRIALSKAGSYWPGDDAAIARLRSSKPDAMIALNAGLSAYHEWKPAVLTSRAFSIPFAVTDYQEVSLASNIRLIMKVLPGWRTTLWSTVTLKPIEDHRILVACQASYPIALNPFMSPGPMLAPMGGGPLAVNGHAMVVTPGAT